MKFMNRLSTNAPVKYPPRSIFYYLQTSTWQKSIMQQKDGASVLQHFYRPIKTRIYKVWYMFNYQLFSIVGGRYWRYLWKKLTVEAGSYIIYFSTFFALQC